MVVVVVVTAVVVEGTGAHHGIVVVGSDVGTSEFLHFTVGVYCTLLHSKTGTENLQFVVLYIVY